MMKKYILAAVSTALLSVGRFAAEETNVKINPPDGTPRVFNADSTGGYGASRVEAKLNVNIKDDTQKVHFIRDNSDPYVVTKAYTIQNADVFILRGVLKTIVSGSIVNSPVVIDSVMYNDGRGVLLISAEEYRFNNAGNGMSMDELVKSLDRKDLVNSSGTVDMAYFPKFIPAKTLLSMMQESGIGFTSASRTAKDIVLSGVSLSTDPDRLAYAVSDTEMNAIVMTAAGFDVNEALHFLKEIDVPQSEIRISYKIVEIYAENDQKLGLDFQAWKNNDGIDLFQAGGKYGTNWNNGLTPNNGHTFAEYYNFNPKWNTKYVDFLTVCGKAKVVSSGSLLVADSNAANLTISDGLFSIVTKDIKDEYSTPKTTATTTSNSSNDTTNTTTVESVTSTSTTGTGTTYTTTEEYAPTSGLIPWTLEAILPNTSAPGCYSDAMKYIPVEALDHNIRQGKTQEVEQTEGNLFQLSVNGGIHRNASVLNFALASTSIIGWDGQGKARLTRSTYNTTIQISSNKKEFVIGGLTKSSVVRSVSGLPLLKDIPVLGWIFSTESDTVKKSQFVLIASAEYVNPCDKLSNSAKTQIDAINKKVDKSVKCPAGTLGFQQWLLDK